MKGGQIPQRRPLPCSQLPWSCQHQSHVVSTRYILFTRAVTQSPVSDWTNLVRHCGLTLCEVSAGGAFCDRGIICSARLIRGQCIRRNRGSVTRLLHFPSAGRIPKRRNKKPHGGNAVHLRQQLECVATTYRPPTAQRRHLRRTQSTALGSPG